MYAKCSHVHCSSIYHGGCWRQCFSSRMLQPTGTPWRPRHVFYFVLTIIRWRNVKEFNAKGCRRAAKDTALEKEARENTSCNWKYTHAYWVLTCALQVHGYNVQRACHTMLQRLQTTKHQLKETFSLFSPLILNKSHPNGQSSGCQFTSLQLGSGL